MRQAGARRSQARAVSWERLAPAWRVTEIAKVSSPAFYVRSGRDKPCPYNLIRGPLHLTGSPFWGFMLGPLDAGAVDRLNHVNNNS